MPPHCPRSDCRFHHSAVGWRWIRFGFFARRGSLERIQRFRCVACRHTFSTQTFSTSYWLQRPDVLHAVAFRILACSGCRQIAREARCSPTTVMYHVARLGRHALLWHAAHRPAGPVREPLVPDGFESFAHSQYHPLYLNLVAGSPSHFCYAFTHTELRRKGRMTARQRWRRAELEAEFGRPDPRGVEDGTLAALRIAVPVAQELVVHSDEHPAYPRALRRLQGLGYRVRHERTSSLDARTAGNPLFPVNRLDLLLRHNSASFKRETIAFCKRNQATVERTAWLVTWQNWSKRFSERHGGGTPAMRLGLESRPIPLREVLKRRLFPNRVPLSTEWWTYYRGELRTRRFAREKRHTLRLAF